MVVRRMNPLGQRLIAAGAQPERAQQFVERAMFDKGLPMTSIGGQRPVKLGDPYDDESQAASRALYPKGFAPPTPDDTSFKSYFDVVFGKGAADKVSKDATIRLAPTFSKAVVQPVGTFEYVVSNGLKDGLSPEVVYENVLNLGIDLVGRSDADVRSYVYKLFGEYNDLQTKLNDAYTDRLSKNKDYKFGLPDPKLRYGSNTDLSRGVVSVLTNPSVAKAYDKFVSGLSKDDPVASQKIAGFLNRAVQAANKAMRTPYRDEVQRREALKGKKIGG